MVNSLLVGIGGFLGALSRFWISRRMNKPMPSFPYGTLIINLLGAFLLGLTSGIRLSELWMLLVGTGFLGAFTTFSTLHWECEQLKQSREWKKFLLYLGVSYTIGIFLAFIGYWVGQTVY
ncbi:fluoride efflux transporter CrcB [Thermoactinomyces sp. DSM 45892]|uniref:fluoride efflux transporter CrcB n=1 Tax=Thermoactinomyces sp. DSM 45892 TaxID=1882753 RepID=UPI0008963111|nr:fluoride efflux transporter CrcB [Thermoactinomyces sp. DSM 45892]SDZ32591.1 camphor resistance protein CrcB [Thermoactinomyces sp. DSM 45892]